MVFFRFSMFERFSVFFVLASAFLFFSCTRKEDPEFAGMVFIPEGEFIRGTDRVDENSFGKDFGTREEKLFENAKPQKKVFLKGYYIDKYEVTNEEFEKYVMQTGILPPATWEDKGKYYPGREKHPVNAIDWYTADRFCKWAGKRLPGEFEWEKAARGPAGNKYPWGNTFDIKKSNLDLQDTIDVGSMAGDKSYYGVYDMAGKCRAHRCFLKFPLGRL
ncbi:MAG: formylglycine-generating enzyme family protein, partial [Nitrospinota bacterium]